MQLAIRRNNDLLRESRSWRYSRRKIPRPDEFSGLASALGPSSINIMLAGAAIWLARARYQCA